jgi:hypothetical protein
LWTAKARNWRLETDAPELALAVVGQQDQRRLLEIEFAPADATATPHRDRLEGTDGVHAFRRKPVPRREKRRIPREQHGREEARDLLLDDRVLADRVARREHEAVAVVRDLGPHHPGRVGQGHARIQHEALLRFRHGRLVTDGRDTAREQRIHQRGLPDVRDAHDHHAQRLRVVFRCGAIDSQSFVTFATSDAFLHDSATAVTPGCFL